jgi:hypothetical protein
MTDFVLFCIAEEKEEKAKVTEMLELRKQGVTIMSGELGIILCCIQYCWLGSSLVGALAFGSKGLRFES